MAKRVYKPNLAFDIALCTSFSVLAAYVVWQYFREGVLFWTLMLSTALVAILVPVVEYLLKIGGQWFSRTYLNDERHQDPLSKVYALKKFIDQGWQFVYHTVFSIWEFCVLHKYNWFEGGDMWYPVTDDLVVPMDIRVIFTVQISLWIYQAYRHVLVNQRKKDYYELFLHHVVTLSLCYYAQRSYYGLGLIILFLHDSSDILVDLLKLINLCKIDGSADFFILEICYIFTLIAWVYERLYTLPIMFWKKAAMGMRMYYHDLNIFQIFKKEFVFCSEILCCWVLYGLHIWWFALLLRLGYRGFVKDPGTIRTVAKEGYEGASDDEDEKEPIAVKQKDE